jgi:hypothetical protein
MRSSFGSLLQTNAIFDLCLVTDKVIQYKNPQEKFFRGHLEFFSQKYGLKLDGTKLKKIGADFDNIFSDTLQKILSSQYKFIDGSSFELIEEDLAITYGFRNRAAHKLGHENIICDNFQKISQRIFNSLFFIIEKLY